MFALETPLGHTVPAHALCALLKATLPKIHKDQLAGAKQGQTEHIKQYGAIPEGWLARLLDTRQD